LYGKSIRVNAIFSRFLSKYGLKIDQKLEWVYFFNNLKQIIIGIFALAINEEIIFVFFKKF